MQYSNRALISHPIGLKENSRMKLEWQLGRCNYLDLGCVNSSTTQIQIACA